MLASAFSKKIEVVSQRLVGEKHLALKLKHKGQPVQPALWSACLTALGWNFLQQVTGGAAMIRFHKAPTSERPTTPQGQTMNTIIYIVGLVVIIGFILSYFGFR